MSKSDQLYATVTARIVEALEAGASGASWRAPWHSTETSHLPVNISTGNPYKGINTFVLWAEQQLRGFTSNEWGTYKQWAAKGAQVKRRPADVPAGEWGTTGIIWKPTKRVIDGEEKDSVYASSFTLFNADQVDGYEREVVEPKSAFDTVEEAEVFFHAIGAEVRHGGSRAYYSSAIDVIQVPEVEDFVDAVGYYATLAHEHVHWTGHESRLNREIKNVFGSEPYAAEELVAELGAAYVCGLLGLTNEPRADHAHYLASWLKSLKADPKAIVTAASKAQRAVDYLVEHAEKKVEVTV